MRTSLAVALALTAALALPAPALADNHDEEPTPPQLCGQDLEFEVLVDKINSRPLENGFQAQGLFVIRVSDEDSSVDLRIPGRIRLTEDPATGIRTIVQNGITLLAPFTQGQLDAQREAGLPDLALIKGKVVLDEQIPDDAAEGPVVPGSERVVSFTRNVTNVCELLDQGE